MNDGENNHWNTYLEERYGDGACGPFAQAISHITRLPVVLLRVRESADPALPDGFPRHAAVLLQNGRLLDAQGQMSLRQLEIRFGCGLRIEKSPDLAQYPFEQVLEGEDWREAVNDAAAYLTHLERKGFTFQSPEMSF